MTERPILFSAPMVRAILEGRKTMTRRVIEAQSLEGATVRLDAPDGNRYFFKPKHAVGGSLWVRETWAPAVCTGNTWHTADGPGVTPQNYKIKFRADADADRVHGKWRSPIFMPRWASRITLEVTAVKVERLQEISEDDAWAEGAPCDMMDPHFPTQAAPPGANYIEDGWDSARDWFQEIWTSINGPNSWDANPWVAAYSFKVLLPK